MEKIQAAIAKARATRTGSVPGPDRTPEGPMPPAPPAPARRPAPSAAGADHHADRWAALPGFQPEPALLARNHIVTLTGGHAAMGFDMMRTRLIQQLQANGWRRVAITSPGAGCGKSTISLNLGFSLARQPELRTLVAEVDLRRPSLARMLGLRGQHSFAQVLAGRAPLADHALRHGDNLAIASNHTASRNPAELLHSSTVGPALDAIEADYAPDIMIFDMPPMLASDDTMAFMPHVDCVLLIAAAGTTTIAEIDSCERELAAQTNVMGVVLNKSRHAGTNYGYPYPDAAQDNAPAP